MQFATIFDKVGDTENETKALKKVIELDPEYCLAHLNLGVNYMREGQKKDAERCFARVIELSPHGSQIRLMARKNLTELYER